MKIAVFDPYLRKFTGDMEKWWLAQGHEVKMDRYYDPELVMWADVVWFDTADNNIKSATNPSEALIDDWKKEGKDVPWDMHEMDLTGKKIIVRPIDIEVWYGHHLGVKWDVVTHCIFVARHIKDVMLSDPLPLAKDLKMDVVPCAVDLDRYTFKTRTHGEKVGIVSEKWTSKGTDLILQTALLVKRMGVKRTYHWLGKWSDYSWEMAYFMDFIRFHELDFEFTEWIEGDNAVNDFLEDKNYLLHASHKEAFSYATAEAMAKGIKPVVHRFYGADDLWPGMTWDSVEQAADMLTGTEYDSEKYRQYLIDHGYTVPQMMEKIMEAIK